MARIDTDRVGSDGVREFRIIWLRDTDGKANAPSWVTAAELDVAQVEEWDRWLQVRDNYPAPLAGPGVIFVCARTSFPLSRPRARRSLHCSASIEDVARMHAALVPRLLHL